MEQRRAHAQTTIVNRRDSAWARRAPRLCPPYKTRDDFAYAVLSRGMIRSAFSRSIAMRSAPLKLAATPLVWSSPVR